MEPLKISRLIIAIAVLGGVIYGFLSQKSEEQLIEEEVRKYASKLFENYYRLEKIHAKEFIAVNSSPQNFVGKKFTIVGSIDNLQLLENTTTNYLYSYQIVSEFANVSLTCYAEKTIGLEQGGISWLDTGIYDGDGVIVNATIKVDKCQTLDMEELV